MNASITSISRRNVACEETFTVTVKLTVGSSELAVNGSVELSQFLMSGWDGEMYDGGNILCTVSGVKIAKGASKTITFTAKAMELQSLIALSPDRGASRAYQYGFDIAADNADGWHNAILTNVGVILSERLAPSIDSLAVTDSTGGLEHFGVLAQNAGRLCLNSAVTLDPLDASLTAKHVLRMTFGSGESAEYTSSDGVFADLSAPCAGPLAWEYTVTDSVGRSAGASGSVSVAEYAAPSIDSLSAERYREAVADDGSVSYVSADDGEYVRFSLTGAVCALEGRNAWTLDAEWGDGLSAAVREGADGGTIVLSDDREAVTEVIPASERVEFAWTLADFFGSVVMRVTVDKAGAYFNVEKNGAAVGMRATGAEGEKKFEVAEDYESHFYGGLFGADGYRMDKAVKWEYLNISHSSFTYSSETQKARIARVGPLVFLEGAAKNTAALSAGFSAVIATLPEWARPAYNTYAIHQGSGRGIYWLLVGAGGDVNISRHRSEAGNLAASAGSTFMLTACWIAKDAFN